MALIERPGTFFGVMLVTAVSIFIQTYSFRLCLPSGAVSPPLRRLVQAWVVGGLTGYIAPLFGGFAMRALLLKSMGLSVAESTTGTLRQSLLNLEYAMWMAGVVLLVWPWDPFPELGLVVMVFAVIWFGIKKHVLHNAQWLPIRLKPYANQLLAPIEMRLRVWMFGLPLIMAVNYFVAFSGFGATLELYEALLLATLTVLISVAAVVPNGLGVLEILWIAIAQKEGLAMSDSVGLALLMRLAYLCSASLLWLWVSMIQPVQNSE